MRANITDQRIQEIANEADVDIGTAMEIIDPEYTYWSDRGDTSREEHFQFIESAPISEVANWVNSIARDMETLG